MTERPILFSAPMVKAILAGAKTMTRRVVKPQPPASAGDVDAHPDYPCEWFYWLNGCERSTTFLCPYGQPGDRLWVREHYYVAEVAGHGSGNGFVIFDDEWTDQEPAPRELRPITGQQFGSHAAFHLPRWASRILLDVVSVRVERLQDISAADAMAEGIGLDWAERSHPLHDATYSRGPVTADGERSAGAVHAFAALWDSINGKRPGCDWGSNPFVWCVSFRRVESTEARATA